MVQEKAPQKDLWAPVDPRQVNEYGAEITDPEKISLWSQAYFFGGNTLRLWNEATELKMALLTACSLQKGQRIFVIGKYAEESGLTQALRSLIGEEGHMVLEEIGPQAVAAFSHYTAPGTRLQWRFSYFDTLPDESLDRVILFGAASHIGNRNACAQQILRVLRDGGRVIIAGVPWGGQELLTVAHMDTHLEGILDKLLAGMKLEEKDLPALGPEELRDIFKPLLSWSRSFSWQGLHLFYGQKGGKEEAPSFEFPPATRAAWDFLIEKPGTGPWDFLAAAEIAGLGSEVSDVNNQKKWARVINWGGGFGRMEEYGSVSIPLYKNLKAEPGYKVLVIGEFLERLFIPELRKYIGETGEIAAFDLNPIHQVTMKKLWEFGPDTYIPERHQWDYPFADDYPDEYFDLVWLPQGVHHARSWKEIAPRLVRVLKPHGQVMMVENRTGNPEFFTGLKMNGLMRCIAEKIWWGWNMTLEELPDHSTAVLEEAFGDSLYDTYSLEWKGWLLFWGYKK